MAYCTIEDLTCRFGEMEIIQLSDKNCQKTGVINEKLVQAKIDDAMAEMDVILSCCYDICTLIQYQVDGYTFPVLKHWNCDIARKHLYDCIRLNVNAGHRDHKAQAEYEDYEKEIEKMCECGRLMAYKYDVDGNVTECIEVPKRYVPCFAVTDDPSACYPKKCCPEPECGCA